MNVRLFNSIIKPEPTKALPDIVKTTKKAEPEPEPEPEKTPTESADPTKAPSDQIPEPEYEPKPTMPPGQSFAPSFATPAQGELEIRVSERIPKNCQKNENFSKLKSKIEIYKNS